MKYDQWIEENGPKTSDEAMGKCKKYVDEMKKQFPELEIQAGFYFDAVWGDRQHWWLKTPDGEIVDPTVHQFPAKSGKNPILYSFIPEDERPIGRCANCGELCYPGAPSGMLCSRRCEIEYCAYINDSIRRF